MDADIAGVDREYGLQGRTTLSGTERLLLDYVRKAKKSRDTVWLSDAITEVGIDPREAIAERLEDGDANIAEVVLFNEELRRKAPIRWDSTLVIKR